MIAGQWGDNAAPGTTMTYPDCVAFLQSLTVTNMIQTGALYVMQRFPSWMVEPELLPLAKLFGPRGMYGPSVLGNPKDPAHGIKFELWAHLFLVPAGINVDTSTLKAQEHPGIAPMNVAAFKSSWEATLPDSPERLALIIATWPGIDGATYESNLAAYRADLPVANPNANVGAVI